MQSDLQISISAKDIYDGVKRLELKMEEMIKHQKETNGKVRCNKQDIAKIQEFKTRAMTLWGVGVVVGTMVVNVLVDKLV